MENTVGLKKLRENLPSYAEKVKKGQTFVVMKKSSPIFRISPVNDNEQLWEEVIDFSKIKKGGVEIEELISRL